MNNIHHGKLLEYEIHFTHKITRFQSAFQVLIAREQQSKSLHQFKYSFLFGLETHYLPNFLKFSYF